MPIYEVDEYGNIIRKDGVGGKSMLPIGMIFASAVYLTNFAYKQLNGQALSSVGVYKSFYDWAVLQAASGNISTCSEEEYEIELDRYSQCGKFVITDTYIRLPTITEHIASNNGGLTLGLAELDSFKSHSHTFDGSEVTTSSDGSHTHSISITNRSGDYLSESSNGTAWRGSSGTSFNTGSGGSHTHTVTAKGTITSTGSDKTQPKTIRYPYYIVVANDIFTEKVSLDVEGLTNDIQLLSGEVSSFRNKMYKLLVDYTLANNSSSIVITGLNLTAGDYIIEVFGRNSSASDVYLTFNGYTDGRYNQTGLYWSTTQSGDLSSPGITTGVRMYKSGFYYASSMRPVEGRIIYKVTVSGNASPNNSNIFVSWETDFCATGYQIFARCGGSTFLPENKIQSVSISGGTIISGAKLKIYKLSDNTAVY